MLLSLLDGRLAVVPAHIFSSDSVLLLVVLILAREPAITDGLTTHAVVAVPVLMFALVNAEYVVSVADIVLPLMLMLVQACAIVLLPIVILSTEPKLPVNVISGIAKSLALEFVNVIVFSSYFSLPSENI